MKAWRHEPEDRATCPARPRVKGAGWLWESTDLCIPNPSGHNRAVHAAVDLHCHILPGLDDGARDLDDAVAMARQAQADGIHTICATPHIRHDHEVRIDELPARIEELSAAVRAAGCRTRILPGGEVAVTGLDRLDDGALANVTLGGSGWILLEPAPGPLDGGFERSVGSLRERGFRTVVAHPERHLSPDLVERLGRLVAAGALVQATAAFLIDEASRPGMLTLARAGLIHVLGSDSHSARAGRPVALARALDVLQTVEPTASHIAWVARTAPEAIVRGQELRAPFPVRAHHCGAREETFPMKSPRVHGP
jgi:protein-tyrosine phosphatase